MSQPIPANDPRQDTRGSALPWTLAALATLITAGIVATASGLGGTRWLISILLLGGVAACLQASVARRRGDLRTAWLLLGLYLLPAIASAWLIGMTAAAVTPKLEPARRWVQRHLQQTELSAPPSRRTPSDDLRPNSSGLDLGSNADGTQLNAPMVYMTFERAADARHFTNRQVYLREQVYTLFDGKRWDGPAIPPVWLRDGDDGAVDGSIRLRSGDGYRHQVFLTEHAQPHMLAMPEAQVVGIPRLIHHNQEAYRLPTRAGQRVSYTVQAEPLTWADIPRDEAVQVAATSPVLLQLPRTDTSERFLRAASDITADATDTRGEITRMLEHFRHGYTYTRDRGEPRENPVGDFFFDHRRGHCELYATSFVLLARSAGIPARLGVGYAGATPDPVSGVYAYTGYNRHAWAEICLDEYGWVIVDPTPASLDPNSLAASRRAGSAFDAQGYQELGDRMDEDAIAAAANAEAEQQAPTVPLTLAGIGIVIAFLFGGLARRRRDAILGSSLVRGEPPPGYMAALDRHFGRAHHSRRPGVTLAEYVAELQAASLIGDELDELLRYHYRTQYEGGSRDTDQEAAFVRRIRALPRPSVASHRAASASASAG